MKSKGFLYSRLGIAAFSVGMVIIFQNCTEDLGSGPNGVSADAAATTGLQAVNPDVTIAASTQYQIIVEGGTPPYEYAVLSTCGTSTNSGTVGLSTGLFIAPSIGASCVVGVRDSVGATTTVQILVEAPAPTPTPSPTILPSPTPTPAAACTGTAWGTLASGQTAIGFSTTSAADCTQVETVITCTNGTITPSGYPYASCQTVTPAPPPQPSCCSGS